MRPWSQTLDASADPSRKEVTIHYLDETPGEPTEWRRIVYRIGGESEYQELMYRDSPEGWKQIAEFKFSRKPEEP